MNKFKMLLKTGIEEATRFVSNSWRFIIAALLLYIVCFLLFMGFFFYTGAGKWADVLIIVGSGAFVFITIWILTFLLVNFIKRMPIFFLACIIGAVYAVYSVGTYLGPFFRLMGYFVLVLGAFSGLTLYLYKKQKKSFFFLSFISTVVLHGIFIYFTATDGKEGDWSLQLNSSSSQIVNPATEKNYDITYFTYGSGSDKRDDYKDVLYQTNPVNISSFIVQPKGWNKWYREWFWGFNLQNAPLNGRVWMPISNDNETFPLVLIVHGNHNMADFSDGGYAYLGEMLAKKGYIAVSVDQNFINSGKSGHIGWDNAGRAWLLLKHLEQWQTWNKTKEHDLFNKIDMDNIALIGHSRGGEAISIAKQFNELERFPNNAKVRLNFDFSIKALIGLSPGDGRFTPGDQPVKLEDVNYLTLQGGNDTDHTNYLGMRQFERVHFNEDFDGFKSSIYIYGGNHGQFNSDWEMDQPAPYWWFMNRKELMTPDTQRDITKIYIASFLDATLKGKKELKKIFEDKNLVSSWVPADPLRVRYENSSFTPLATFEEDVDVTTSTIGGEMQGHNLQVWKEINLLQRNKEPQYNQVVKLGWSSRNSRYTLIVPNTVSDDFHADTVLRFDAVQAHPERYEFYHIPVPEGYQHKPIPITVSLKPKGVSKFDSRLRTTVYIDPTYSTKLYRFNWWNKRFGNEYEHMLHTYEVPIDYWKDSFPTIDFSNIEEISFEFNQTNSGLIFLDNIGFY
ncbi:hypothetical protein [Sutcliffiella rhizosphaerae]|uniref:Alpha/beta hydrolase n=1 Tax=Sutcliffiella rhizosphaerae TaxID=2880967 RepID=A0ABM8YJ59_9BACI|nr:hypothetical protein [Sutcliffiella rhizosphaerae]CAG9619930.1 hypothetical protein BACCIP111883_00698 [Sutcliffiella rhizosphaerae]